MVAYADAISIYTHICAKNTADCAYSAALSEYSKNARKLLKLISAIKKNEKFNSPIALNCETKTAFIFNDLWL